MERCYGMHKKRTFVRFPRKCFKLRLNIISPGARKLIKNWLIAGFYRDTVLLVLLSGLFVPFWFEGEFNHY